MTATMPGLPADFARAALDGPERPIRPGNVTGAYSARKGTRMTTVLTEHIRRAAHGKHRCGWCGWCIVAGERYRDQRCADNGTAWTWREHLTCADLVREFMDGDEVEGHPHDIWREATAGKEPS